MELSIIIFALFILVLLSVSYWASARRKGDENEEYFLGGRSLKWYLIAISAGATANTGFIVTGAVGMGYSSGISALLLPLSWFLGDLVFWLFFPHRINRVSREEDARTISDLLTSDFVKGAKTISVITGLILIFSMITYTIAQWAAAAITFTGFYNVSVPIGILISGTLVSLYCIFGGFRSSVYADLVQGTFMVLLTVAAIALCLWSVGGRTGLLSNDTLIKEGYLDIFKGMSLFTGVGFIIGWSFAALGFGLSQPHIMDKYFAGRSESEVRKAKWLYLFFVQLTWTGMTFLGVLIKFVIPNVDNAEAALSTLVSNSTSQIFKGVVVCGVFATIASTADSLLIASANSIRNDILANLFPTLKYPKYSNQLLTLLIAVLTVSLAAALAGSSVFDLAVFAILLSATISPAVIIKVLGFRNSPLSLSLCIISALAAALTWHLLLNFSGYLNQAVIGIVVGLVVNFTVVRLIPSSNTASD